MKTCFKFDIKIILNNGSDGKMLNSIFFRASPRRASFCKESLNVDTWHSIGIIVHDNGEYAFCVHYAVSNFVFSLGF